MARSLQFTSINQAADVQPKVGPHAALIYRHALALEFIFDRYFQRGNPSIVRRRDAFATATV